MKLNDEIRKNDPFRVPDGYFETLADRAMAAIREEEARREHGNHDSVTASDEAAGEGQGNHPGRFTFRSDDQAEISSTGRRRILNLRPFLALAATILGFAILAAVVIRLATADRETEGYQAGSSLYADLAFEEVATYMLENELNLTEPEGTEITGEEISTEAIIDYLMTEGIDLKDIYELL